jgi:CheY-like chemotaxis protein
LNLLLVEDNLPDELMVREAIREQDLPCEIHTAADGVRAIEFLVKSETDPLSPSPDLVLLDLNLPKVDGFEVLRRIRASAKHGRIPVIVVTSSDSPMDRSEAGKLADGYFRKPADYFEFLKLGVFLRQFFHDHHLL